MKIPPRYEGPQSLIEHGMMGIIDWMTEPKPQMRTALEPVLYWANTMPRAGAFWSRKDQFNDISRQSLSSQMKVVRSRGELEPDDLPVICVLRNEAERLPVFFDHYKSLGATRFIMIDNNSDDGSREILLAEPLADVYHATASYRDSGCGIYWQNGIAREYCIGHWVAVVDADELLVYDGMETRNLPDLARLLDAGGQDRILSMLLDVYPSGTVGRGDRSIEDILDNDCYFDSEGYHTSRDEEGWAIRGGARARLFEQRKGAVTSYLSKFPFFLMNKETVIWNAHYLWPYDRLEKTPESILLHLKLMDDFADRTKKNIAEDQHWNGSTHYREIDAVFDDTPDIVALHANSRRYRGPKSLIRYRLMKPIAWR